MAAHPDTDGIVTSTSPLSVPDAVARLTTIVETKGLHLFAIIDHSGEAEKAGLTMRDTKLVIFGSPQAGTPVMVAAPLAALDLPLKVLIWQDADGATCISYIAPAYLAGRHHLSGDLEARLEPITAIADALTTR